MPRRRIAALLLVVAAVVWVFANGPFEGHVLLFLDRAHGVTAADLLSVYGLLGAAWLWVTA